MTPCSVCLVTPVFGDPSAARWIGPDGEKYCSMHFINRFGHDEPLVKIEDFEAPVKKKAPPKEKAAPKGKAPKEVKA